jgi:hypothetical protein
MAQDLQLIPSVTKLQSREGYLALINDLSVILSHHLPKTTGKGKVFFLPE